MKNLLIVQDRISQAAFVLACAALLVLLGAYLYEVIARYGFSAPTRWSSDLVQYALCASVCLALPVVTRDGGHVAITSFLEKLPPLPLARATQAIQWLGVLALWSAAAVFTSVALSQWRQGIETVAAYAIPKWWLTALVVFGLFAAGGHLLRQACGIDAAQAGHEMDV